jgi:LacI family transcriptional regulator
MSRDKPTLRTLASATGLAVTTVSRALKDAPEIAEATRNRVREAASRIGYSPDRAALRLKTGKTRVIAFLLEPHDEMLSFGTRMIAGIVSALRDTGYHLVVMPQFTDEDPLETVRNIVRNRLADGMIFCRTKPFDERVRLLLEDGFPFVSHGRTELTTPHDCVDFDNFAFGQEAARILIAQKRRRIALLGAAQPYTYSQHMRHGFMTAVRESGIAFDIPDGVDITSPAEEIAAYARSALSRHGVDGFVCGGEASALAIEGVLAEMGLSPGGQVGIVAKQTTPLFDQMSRGMTTIFEDLEAAGRALGDCLLNRLADGEIACQQIVQQPGLDRQAMAIRSPSKGYATP